MILKLINGFLPVGFLTEGIMTPRAEGKLTFIWYMAEFKYF